MSKIYRTVAYIRVSGAGQKGNTSAGTDEEAGTQEKAIRSLLEREESFQLVHKKFYRDIAKSGKTTEGRDAFNEIQRLVDAKLIDLVVISRIDRFARSNIMYRVKKWRASGVYVKDCVAFDSRYIDDPSQYLIQGVQALVAETEHMTINTRTYTGRKERASQGLPWTGKNNWPFGRDFIPDNPKKPQQGGKWVINAAGKALIALLEDYLEGKGTMTELCERHSCEAVRFTRPKVSKKVNQSQIDRGEGQEPYMAKFKDGDEKEVPGMVPLVTKEFLEQVKYECQIQQTLARYRM